MLLSAEAYKKATRRLEKKRRGPNDARAPISRNIFEIQRDLWRMALESDATVNHTNATSSASVAQDSEHAWFDDCDPAAGAEDANSVEPSALVGPAERITTIYRPEEHEALCANWSALLPRLHAPYEAFRSSTPTCRPCPVGCDDEACTQTRRRHRVIMVSFLGGFARSHCGS